MQSVSSKYVTNRQDVLIKSRYSNLYRLTNGTYYNDLEENPLTVTFRPSGWLKDVQLKVQYGSMYLNNMRGSGITVTAQVIGQNSRVIESERVMYKAFVNYTPTPCPFCSAKAEWNIATSRWKCTNDNCGFDYSKASCEEIGKIYSKVTQQIRGIKNKHMFHVLANSNDNLHILKL